jgi:hypothetical protein
LSKGEGIFSWAPLLKDWLKDPDYVFWLGLTWLRREMAISMEKVEELPNMKKEELRREGLRALMEKRYRELRVGILIIYLKYKVSSLEELDEKINRGKLSETETFEDLTRLDFLESEADKIKHICRVIT